ncbi:MAG: amino acid ABC transporter substrate-binding protein [Pseudomonadota bacterium]
MGFIRSFGRGFGTLVAFALTAGAAQSDALDDIREGGAISLGYRTDAPPFSSLSSLGEPEGLAISLCRDAAKQVRAALELETLAVNYVPVTAADRFDALAEGRIHLLCGPTTQTLARREALDFSIPYFIDGSSVVFRAGPIETVDDIRGEAIGYLGDTTTEDVVGALLAERGVEALERAYASHLDGLAALQSGEIAAYFGDQAILRYLIGEIRPTVPLRFSPNQFSFEPYALAMRRGETRLRLEVDRALSETFASGAIYTHINASLGEVTLSDIALAVYQVVTLPE